MGENRKNLGKICGLKENNSKNHCKIKFNHSYNTEMHKKAKCSFLSWDGWALSKGSCHVL